MTFVSHAQNMEDVILWRALKDIDQGFYIDVGANDPDFDSVTKAFYLQGWKGINIEPVCQWYDKLCASRPRDINLQLAAGEKKGELVIYEIPDTGLSTLDKNIAERHKKENGHSYKTHKVNVLSLTEIIKSSHESAIHFLKIDVEGAEKQVIQGIDFSTIRPWIIVVESTLPNTQIEDFEHWEPLLIAGDYKYVYFDGLNRYYLAKEHEELTKKFDAPPNYFDDFVFGEKTFFCSPLANQVKETKRNLDQTLETLEQQKHIAEDLVKQLNTLNSDYKNISKELETANSGNLSFKSELDVANSTIKNLTKELELANSGNLSFRSELDAANSTIKNLTKELELANSGNLSFRNELDIANSTIKNLTEELNLVKLNNLNFENELAAANTTNKKLSGNLKAANSDNEKLKSELRRFKKQHHALSSELESSRAMTQIIQQNLESAKSKNKSYLSELTQSKEKIAELNYSSHYWWQESEKIRKELDAIYNGTFWLMTWPIRKTMHTIRQGIDSVKSVVSRTNNAAKNILKWCLLKAIAFVKKHPRIKIKVGLLLSRFPSTTRKLQQISHSNRPIDLHETTQPEHNTESLSVDLSIMTPTARKFYRELKSTMTTSREIS